MVRGRVLLVLLVAFLAPFCCAQEDNGQEAELPWSIPDTFPALVELLHLSGTAPVSPTIMEAPTAEYFASVARVGSPILVRNASRTILTGNKAQPWPVLGMSCVDFAAAFPDATVTTTLIDGSVDMTFFGHEDILAVFAREGTPVRVWDWQAVSPLDAMSDSEDVRDVVDRVTSMLPFPTFLYPTSTNADAYASDVNFHFAPPLTFTDARMSASCDNTLLVQVRGTQRITLAPPPDVIALDGQPGMEATWIQMAMHHTPYWSFELHEGEIAYIPPGMIYASFNANEEECAVMAEVSFTDPVPVNWLVNMTQPLTADYPNSYCWATRWNLIRYGMDDPCMAIGYEDEAERNRECANTFFDAVDHDGSGAVTMAELLNWMALQQPESMEHASWAAQQFLSFNDANVDGSVTRDEVLQTFASLSTRLLQLTQHTKELLESMEQAEGEENAHGGDLDVDNAEDEEEADASEPETDGDGNVNHMAFLELDGEGHLRLKPEYAGRVVEAEEAAFRELEDEVEL